MIPALGKLPATVDPRTLRLETYVDRGVLPAPPPSIDNTGLVANWGGDLGGEDVGCCVPDYGCWADTLMSTMGGKPYVYDTADAYAAYTALTGWTLQTGGQGPGVDPLVFLNWWRKVGIAGRTIGAYTTVGSGWVPWAVNLFGAAAVGLGMPLAWQVPYPAFTWDLPKGQATTGAWAQSSWGGHFVLVTGYDGLGVWVISWGQKYRLTWAGWNEYSLDGEVYCAIAKDMLGPNGTAPNGFNGLQLAADLEQFGPVDV